MFRFLVQKILAYLTRLVIRRYKPQIIGITGSVGKTTTKAMVACVLAARFSVRESFKNYNNEFGLPLTVLGSISGGRSIFSWVGIILKAFKLLIFKDKNYPEMLVLEMGIDRPNDMDYLLSLARPHRAVITKLGSAHLEFFPSKQALHAEKIKLAKGITQDGFAFYNYDDENCRNIFTNLPIRAVNYGFNEGAQVRAEALKIFLQQGEAPRGGLTFKLTADGSSVPVRINYSFAQTSVYSALAAAAVGLSYGLNAIEISKAIEACAPVPGRMHVLAGLNGSCLVDDSYNASPEAMIEGLSVTARVAEQNKSRVLAVLGDMKELGEESVSGHEAVGKKCAELKIDRLITVGEDAKIIGEAASRAGLPAKNISHFTEATVAGEEVFKEIKAGDIVFIKGSQAARLDRVAAILLADKKIAEEVLVRQGKEWW